MVCKHTSCSNWIYTDKLRPGTKCSRCGTWWPTSTRTTGKGKGHGKPANKAEPGHRTWPDPPPGLSKLKPLKRSKVQQEATELLSTAWTSLSEDTQTKLQAIGIGPTKPEEPQLTSTGAGSCRQAHNSSTPEPCTEREIAAKLKGQVSELKNMSIKKTQLQTKIDQVKSQYAALLSDMQELQSKLADGQMTLKNLSEDYMKAVNQTPAPEDLTKPKGEGEQIPMAVESFVHSLGIPLTEEQKTQLHGLLKRLAHTEV